MFAVLLVLTLPAAFFVICGIVAFIMLPIKAGIVVAILAFTLAAVVFSIMAKSIDLSH